MKHLTTEEIEHQLNIAIDGGDARAIDRLGRHLDRLAPPATIGTLDEPTVPIKPPPSMLAAALWYASVGLHVFPLQPGEKAPLSYSHGSKDATTDENQIRRWWKNNLNFNIAIATGHRVDVIDIDGTLGHRSRVEHWGEIFETIEKDHIGKALTPRAGGMHIYTPAVGESNATNVVPGVDVRGAGGYVVAPPSRTAEGVYEWIGTPQLEPTD